MRRLDSVESAALTYLVAFDLSSFEAAYTLGTDHPKVTWATRMPAKMRDLGLPGPDGIGRSSRWCLPGWCRRTCFLMWRPRSPWFQARARGLRVRAVGRVNHASHYGFISNGVVFEHVAAGTERSVRRGARVEMKTWTEADNSSLSNPSRKAERCSAH